MIAGGVQERSETLSMATREKGLDSLVFCPRENGRQDRVAHWVLLDLGGSHDVCLWPNLGVGEVRAFPPLA
uniref:Uncharacterized protein n=1 Tax=Acrobeloides nanus TaxID=290746 RepID=A0A914ENB9_9BILA